MTDPRSAEVQERRPVPPNVHYMDVWHDGWTFGMNVTDRGMTDRGISAACAACGD